MSIPNEVQETLQELKKAAEHPAVPAKPTVGQILRDYLPWIQESGKFSLLQQQSARLMSICKTPDLGTCVDYCPNCQKVVGVRYRSCNNRNCPGCQFPLQQKWIELRKAEVVENTPQFHIVLTMPHELNELIQANPNLLLGILFKSSAQAVIEMCEDPQRLGAKPGITSVIHTWTQDLRPHYHVHMICTAGGITPSGEYVSVPNMFPGNNETEAEKSLPLTESADADTDDDIDDCIDDDIDDDNVAENGPSPQDAADTGRKDGKNFFIPLNALTNLFRGKYMAALKDAYDARKLTFPGNLDYLNDPYEWSCFCHRLYVTKWVGNIVKTFDGAGNAIQYLARYTFRTAISNSRIIRYDGKHVTFLVRDNKNPRERKPITLEVHEFISRFLAHILPKGFTRVRFYGYLANGQKKKNLTKIFQQLGKRQYKPSPLKDLSGMNLLKALFPGKKLGCCPACGTALETYTFDVSYSPAQTIPVASRAAPAA